VAKYPQWTLLEAGNGDQALEISEGKDIDYFSLDLNMPGMDGLELLVKLKLKFTDSRFSLMTANIQQATHDKATALGAACTNKPITEDSVSSMLAFFSENNE
jgi:CheY-like chemotaxis protein